MKTVIQFSFLFLLVIFTACSKAESIPSEGSVNDDLEGPISRPTSGYGKDGDFEVAEIDFPSPEYAGKEVAIFYPKGATTPRPTIFYAHAYGGENKASWLGIFHFIAKKDTPLYSHLIQRWVSVSTTGTMYCGPAFRQP